MCRKISLGMCASVSDCGKGSMSETALRNLVAIYKCAQRSTGQSVGKRGCLNEWRNTSARPDQLLTPISWQTPALWLLNVLPRWSREEAHRARLSIDSSVLFFQGEALKETPSYFKAWGLNSIDWVSVNFWLMHKPYCQPGRTQRWPGFGNRPQEVLVEGMGSSWIPRKQTMCAHTGTPGSRNPSHPHIIRITFPTDQEILLDARFGFLCGSHFSHKFLADTSMGLVLNAAQHCQLCTLCSHREQLVLRIFKSRFLWWLPQGHFDWEGRAVFLSFHLTPATPQLLQKKSLLFHRGSSKSHWNKFSSHPITRVFRTWWWTAENSFPEHWQKK